MKAIKNIAVVALMLCTISAFSQEKEKKKKKSKDVKISVLVKDPDNKPLPGAVILIDNVKQKRRTNSKGYFKAKLDKAPKEISAFSPSIGIKKVKYKEGHDLIITIPNGKDHFVHSSHQKKGINPVNFRNIYDYMRGQVPGVSIDSNNDITIRGYNSVNGSTTPLFVVNGTAVDQSIFGNLVPTNIKTIRVLKGTETSQYGARGANGVIIVETF